MMAEVTLRLLMIVPGILQRTGAVGGLPLPTKTLLTEFAGLAERRPTKAGLSSLLLRDCRTCGITGNIWRTTSLTSWGESDRWLKPKPPPYAAIG